MVDGIGLLRPIGSFLERQRDCRRHPTFAFSRDHLRVNKDVSGSICFVVYGRTALVLIIRTTFRSLELALSYLHDRDQSSSSSRYTIKSVQKTSKLQMRHCVPREPFSFQRKDHMCLIGCYIITRDHEHSTPFGPMTI